MPRITPNLWYEDQALEAAEFYVSVFPNSSLGELTYYPQGARQPLGMVMTVDFVLDGQKFTAINGGPEFTFVGAVSFQVECNGQDEVDYYWSRLSDGGDERACGWLRDRFGLFWQVIPVGLTDIVNDPDPDRAGRALRAVLRMKKVDLDAVRAAADQPGPPPSRH